MIPPNNVAALLNSQVQLHKLYKDIITITLGNATRELSDLGDTEVSQKSLAQIVERIKILSIRIRTVYEECWRQHTTSECSDLLALDSALTRVAQMRPSASLDEANPQRLDETALLIDKLTNLSLNPSEEIYQFLGKNNLTYDLRDFFNDFRRLLVANDYVIPSPISSPHVGRLNCVSHRGQ